MPSSENGITNLTPSSSCSTDSMVAIISPRLAEKQSKKPSKADDAAHQAFLAWAASHGVQFPNLSATAFSGAGTGISSGAPIKKGTPIAVTPTPMLFNRESLPPALSPRKFPHLSTHALLATHLALSLRSPETSPWEPWLRVLPSPEELCESMPLLWNLSLQGIAEEVVMPSGLLRLLRKQREKVARDWDGVSKAGLLARGCEEEFRYAWMIVNTRSLYYRPQKTTYKTLEAADCLTLCPFIDYFNHEARGTEASVTLTPKGYTVTAAQDYAAGEQIFVSYGPHNNDFLLVEYGFLLGENRWDTLSLDTHVIKHLNQSQRNYLEESGFLGEYTAAPKEGSAGLCFRTQVAIRAGWLESREIGAWPESEGVRRWRAFVEGRSSGDQEKERVAKVVNGWLAEEDKRRKKAMMILGPKVAGEQGWKGMLRERWEQVGELVEGVRRGLEM